MVVMILLTYAGHLSFLTLTSCSKCWDLCIHTWLLTWTVQCFHRKQFQLVFVNSNIRHSRSFSLYDIFHSTITLCKLSLPPHGVTVDQCLTPAVHDDDDSCDVSASLHPASVVQSQHLEPRSHAAVHDWWHCLPAGHNATFQNTICFHDKQFLENNITKAKHNATVFQLYNQ